jgi:hypothetical protein
MSKGKEAPLFVLAKRLLSFTITSIPLEFAREISSARGGVERTIRVFPFLGKSSSLTSTAAEILRHSAGRPFHGEDSPILPFRRVRGFLPTLSHGLDARLHFAHAAQVFIQPQAVARADLPCQRFRAVLHAIQDAQVSEAAAILK